MAALVIPAGSGCGGGSTAPAAGRLSDAESHAQMQEAIRHVTRHVAERNIYLSETYLEAARTKLAAVTEGGSPHEKWSALYQLARMELNHAREGDAVEHYLQAHALLPQIEGQIAPALAHQFLFDIGVAYLRVAETQNCCQRNTPESCIVPIQGGGVHAIRDGSTKAADFFRLVLDRTDSAAPIHLAAQWLLNVAHMTLGDYPTSVPSEHLIPPAALESDAEIPRFRNIAAEAGLDTFSLAGGAIADDFDNDGHLDLVVSSWDPQERLRVFWNRDGRFVEDEATKTSLEGISGGLNLIQADYNNDGHTDVFVLRGGWLDKEGRYPDSLLKNNGDGTFTDVTYAALPNEHYPSQTAAWLDFDRDGDLDLFVGNESSPLLSAPCQLLRNDDGRFTDVAQSAGVTNGRMAKGVACGDYDDDGWTDIYVSNFKSANRLYRNQGDGTFIDVAERLGVAEPIESFPVWFWDFDNDGALDLFVAAYSGGISEIAASYLGRPVDSEKSLARLYRNDGRGGFEDVAARMNLDRVHLPMGANFGDLDNDGYLDFYLGTGWPELHEIMPNAMYRNDRGRGFLDVSTAGGFAHLQKGHAVVFADLDNDGDEDVFEQMGGFVPADRYHDVLYENPGNSNHWISLKLIGKESNRSAIGAQIRVRISEADGLPRDIYRHVGTGSSFGANPLTQHIGLGSATSVELVEVTWPTTRHTQRFDNVLADRFYELREGEPALRTATKGRWSLSKSPRTPDEALSH